MEDVERHTVVDAPGHVEAFRLGVNHPLASPHAHVDGEERSISYEALETQIAWVPSGAVEHAVRRVSKRGRGLCSNTVVSRLSEVSGDPCEWCGRSPRWLLGTQLQAGQEPRRPAVLGRLLEGIGDP